MAETFDPAGGKGSPLSVCKPHFVLTEKYLQIYVELPKLAEVAPELMTPGELFLDAMSKLSTFDERPAAYSDKRLDRLFSESVYGGMTDEEKAKHDNDMTTERDYAESIKYWSKINRDEGREEGRKEGREAERLEIARNIKAAGVDVDTIVKYTGLSPEVVQAL